jgi:hypothetical protein
MHLHLEVHHHLKIRPLFQALPLVLAYLHLCFRHLLAFVLHFELCFPLKINKLVDLSSGVIFIRVIYVHRSSILLDPAYHPNQMTELILIHFRVYLFPSLTFAFFSLYLCSLFVYHFHLSRYHYQMPRELLSF